MPVTDSRLRRAAGHERGRMRSVRRRRPARLLRQVPAVVPPDLRRPLHRPEGRLVLPGLQAHLPLLPQHAAGAGDALPRADQRGAGPEATALRDGIPQCGFGGSDNLSGPCPPVVVSSLPSTQRCKQLWTAARCKPQPTSQYARVRTTVGRVEAPRHNPQTREPQPQLPLGRQHCLAPAQECPILRGQAAGLRGGRSRRSFPPGWTETGLCRRSCSPDSTMTVLQAGNHLAACA